MSSNYFMKKQKSAIHGFVNLDKPCGLSSNQALQQVKKLFNAAKAGHTGSLDPLASGVLPICFGHATRLSGMLLDADKSYQAGITLGITTTTGDREGEIITRKDFVPDKSQIQTVLQQFEGDSTQIPPMYSALKKNGQPLYKLARKGVVVAREPRPIHIERVQLLSFEYPHLNIMVTCSKGTYIRTLAEDIGRALGCGAHLHALRRTRAGGFEIGQSVSLAQLQQARETENLGQYVLPLDTPLQKWPLLRLEHHQVRAIQQGQRIHLFRENLPADFEDLAGACLRLYDHNRLVALAECENAGINTLAVSPKRVFMYDN